MKNNCHQCCRDACGVSPVGSDFHFGRLTCQAKHRYHSHRQSGLRRFFLHRQPHSEDASDGSAADLEIFVPEADRPKTDNVVALEFDSDVLKLPTVEVAENKNHADTTK